LAGDLDKYFTLPAGGISGSYLVKLNDFTNPQDVTAVDPELGEINRPRLAGNVTFDWS
jgi:iron complex outermembrane receptor protein